MTLTWGLSSTMQASMCPCSFSLQACTSSSPHTASDWFRNTSCCDTCNDGGSTEQFLSVYLQLEIPDSRLTFWGDCLVLGDGVQAVKEHPVVGQIAAAFLADGLQGRGKTCDIGED